MIKNYLYYLATGQDVKLDPSKIPQIPASELLSNALNLVYIVSGIVCVLIIIIAGFSFVTSSGNAETVKKAKSAIMYAVVGLIAVSLAFALTWFVIGRF